MSMRILLFLLMLELGCSCSEPTPEERVKQMLMERVETMAVAESCTGGSIAARFTALPGASAVFRCGFVVYAQDSKVQMLGVNPDTLMFYGAVSEPVVRAMAESARLKSESYYAIATTGIAGPTGGTPETPVGSVWIAVSTPAHTRARLLHLAGNRAEVIYQAGSAAIELLEEELLSLDPVIRH